jgi:hypothetical protein
VRFHGGNWCEATRPRGLLGIGARRFGSVGEIQATRCRSIDIPHDVNRTGRERQTGIPRRCHRTASATEFRARWVWIRVRRGRSGDVTSDHGRFCAPIRSSSVGAKPQVVHIMWKLGRRRAQPTMQWGRRSLGDEVSARQWGRRSLGDEVSGRRRVPLIPGPRAQVRRAARRAARWLRGSGRRAARSRCGPSARWAGARSSAAARCSS